MNELRSNKTNSSDIRTSNISLILRLIWENAPASRADLARATGLTRSTASSLTTSLLEMGFIKEIGLTSNNVGKRATLLDIRTDLIFVVSIKLSNSCMHIAKVDLRGKVHDLRKQVLNENSTTDAINTLLSVTRSYLAEMRDQNQKCYGIGITVPSPIFNGGMVFASSFKSLENINLKVLFAQEFNGPVYISNNADAAALAETWFGHYNQINNMVFLLLDQGIGCGIVLNRELYLGASQLSNEFGHMILKKNGPRCFCGNDGCMTSLASDWAIQRRIAESDMALELAEMLDSEADSMGRLSSYMRSNPEKFAKYTNEAAQYLGIGIANITDIFVPDLIVLDGDLAYFPNFINRVMKSCQAHVHPLFRDTIKISHSRLGKDASLIGASTFLIQDLFADPTQMQKAE